MAERRNSGDGSDGHGPAESGQQDDRSHVAPGADMPAEPAEGGDIEENEDRTDAGAGSTEETRRQEDPRTDRDAGDREEVTEPGGEVIFLRDRQDTVDRKAADRKAAEAERASEEAGTGELDAGERDAEDSDDDELDDVLAEAVDLAELQADDELLDELGGTDPDVEPDTERSPDLEALLVAWRRDVDATPIGELVDTDAAVAAVEKGRKRPKGRKRRHLVPVATAAAVLMITFTGVGLAARDAVPGDALWGVAQVLYTDHARSAKAASRAEAQLQKASTAWEHGKESAAKDALHHAKETMQSVDPSHGLSDLQAAHASLSAKFERKNPEEDPSTSSSASPSEVSSVPTTSSTEAPSSSKSSQPPTTTSSQPTSTPTRPSEPTTSDRKTTTSPPTTTSGTGESSSTADRSSTSGRVSGSTSSDSRTQDSQSQDADPLPE